MKPGAVVLTAGRIVDPAEVRVGRPPVHLLEELVVLLSPAALQAATTVAASALAVGAVAGLSYAAEAVVGAEPSGEVVASLSETSEPDPSATPEQSGPPQATASPSESSAPDPSPSPTTEEVAPTAAPSATASTGATTSPEASATTGAGLVRAQASNVVVTAVDGTSITADGATWTAAPTVKVNLRGRASLADVVVGMRVHLRGWSSAGALTVEHVVVPNTPANRALQTPAPDAAAAPGRAKGPKGKAPAAPVEAPSAKGPAKGPGTEPPVAPEQAAPVAPPAEAEPEDEASAGEGRRPSAPGKPGKPGK